MNNLQPANIALLVSGITDYQKGVVEEVLKGDQTLEKNLIELGRYWKVKVWFKYPVHIKARTRGCYGWGEKEVTSHVFSFSEAQEGGLLYMMKHRGHRGHFFGQLMLNAIDKYEVVMDDGDRPLNFNEFKSRIDKRFMTEAKMEEIWKDKNCTWTRKTFRRIGKEGLRVLERFLQKFKSLDSTDTTHYTKTGEGKDDERWDLCDYYHSFSRSQNIGRDIKINHLLGHPLIWWSSEYPGCGNGSYGFLATERTWLHYEDD